MPSDEAAVDLADRVIERVRARARMRIASSGRDQVLRVAQSRAEARGVPLATWVDSLDRVDAGPELELVVRELAVGETYLFRGPVFDVLRRHVLPELVQRKRRDGSRTLRVASAGCATGEEVYSLAACIAEATAGDPGFLAGVLGLDLNPAFLARAEEGRYRRWSLRGVEPAAVEPWFEVEGEEWVARPALRAMARFQLADLVRDPVPSTALGLAGMDLILCQNVLIYLERDARERAVEGLARSLSPGGLLFFGPSDLVGNDVPHTTAQRWGDVVGHRRGEDPPARRPPESHRPAAAPPDVAATPQQRASTAPPPAPAATYERAVALADAGDVAGALAELDRLLLTHHDRADAHTLQGLLLTDSGAPGAALEAFRRALYLEPTALLALGGAIAAARKLGRDDLVRRHALRLRAVHAAHPADAPVEGWDGMTAARLLQLARSHGERG